MSNVVEANRLLEELNPLFDAVVNDMLASLLPEPDMMRDFLKICDAWMQDGLKRGMGRDPSGVILCCAALGGTTLILERARRELAKMNKQAAENG